MGTTDRMPLPDAPGRESPVEGTDFFSSSPVLFPVSHPAGREEKVFVTRDRIRLARKADLARFLLQRHPDLFRNSGNSLYMKSRDSLYIRKGFPGYTDFSSGGHGNPIDFLTEPRVPSPFRRARKSPTAGYMLICSEEGSRPV